MSETLQLEEIFQPEQAQLHDAPKLLVEWSSPWEEFVTSIRPALSRSTSRLAGEAPYGVFPYRGMLASLLVQAFLIFVAIVVPAKIEQLRPYAPPRPTGHEVIYYSGDELPRTEDLGGAQSGLSGRAGGNQARHRTQTIKVARGGSLVQKVVDAPNLKLPATREAVANLLAIRPNPGPPPADGLRSSRSVLTLPNTVVAPAPSVIRELTRGSLSLQTVVPPAPSVSRDRALVAPTLNSTVIPPAPTVSRDRSLPAPALGTNVVAPAPKLSDESTRSAPTLTANVIPPAPGVVSSAITRSPVQMTNAGVVPPPVSSPEREMERNAKLTLPAPSVVAPPPSADRSADLRRLAAGTVSNPSSSVVPPPPAAAGSGSLMSSLVGKIFGTTDVVPPPPNAVKATSAGTLNGMVNGRGNSLGTSVVPPPPTVNGPSGVASGIRAGTGTTPGTEIVPPPPSFSGAGGGTGNSSKAGGFGGTLLANNVIPPPPAVGGGAAISSSGRGTKGLGLGGPLDSGSVLAPPSGGGSGTGSGVVLSTQPGSKIGIPGNGGAGSLSMSPTGGDKPGVGGSGGGTGIGRGDGPGSGLTGAGTGAGRAGSGHGSDPRANGGISPTAGPGGAGNAAAGTPAVPGVSVSGGSSIVTLPSFGSDGSSGAPIVPGRSSLKEQQGPAITVVASSRSGGAFNFYGKLPGDNYTVYVDTSVGIVVMQFADPASATHHNGTLTGPQSLRTDLPADLPHARMVVACTLDSSGNLKNLHVLEPGPAAMTAKVMASLPGWKFRPATRGNQPVEVNAILGFGIDTNDRY